MKSYFRVEVKNVPISRVLNPIRCGKTSAKPAEQPGLICRFDVVTKLASASLRFCRKYTVGKALTAALSLWVSRPKGITTSSPGLGGHEKSEINRRDNDLKGTGDDVTSVGWSGS